MPFGRLFVGTADSYNGPALICGPIGKPELVKPQGTEIVGMVLQLPSSDALYLVVFSFL